MFVHLKENIIISSFVSGERRSDDSVSQLALMIASPWSCHSPSEAGKRSGPPPRGVSCGSPQASSDGSVERAALVHLVNVCVGG